MSGVWGQFVLCVCVGGVGGGQILYSKHAEMPYATVCSFHLPACLPARPQMAATLEEIREKNRQLAAANLARQQAISEV